MSIKTILTTVGTKIKVHSPAILLVTGAVSIVAGTVAACIQTTKLETIVDDAKEKLDIINQSINHDIIKKEEGPKLKTQCYFRTALSVTKLYAVPAILVTGGLGMIFGAHHVLSTRYSRTLLQLNTTMSAFNLYRRNVAAKFGKAEDYNCYNNKYLMTEEQKADLADKDQRIRDERYVPWHGEGDRCFDESNPNWTRDALTNQFFLKCKQNYINDRIKWRRSEKMLKNGVIEVYPGWITAHEVDEITGWNRPDDVRACMSGVGKMTDGACDPLQPDYFDFGVFESDDEGAKAFIAGDEHSVWLHPNYDGVITDKIGVPLYFKDGVRCDKHGNPI